MQFPGSAKGLVSGDRMADAAGIALQTCLWLHRGIHAAGRQPCRICGRKDKAGNHAMVLGGNQGDTVSIRPFALQSRGRGIAGRPPTLRGVPLCPSTAGFRRQGVGG